MVYGWRGKIGVIFPFPGAAPKVNFTGRYQKGLQCLQPEYHLKESHLMDYLIYKQKQR